MTSTTQHGYLVLADISGYTSYLAGVELDHAHEILTELLEIIVGRFKTLFTISKLEGDAVFAYVPETVIMRGETLIELVESTYVAFCDRRDSSHRHTTCECRACQNMPNLDLKFFVHHGDFVVQHVSGIRELVGSDVNLVHRMMKNRLSEQTGWKAYLMLSEKGLEHLKVKPADMYALTESYEHLGEVQTFSFDLRARRTTLAEARREVVRPEDAHYIVDIKCQAPPPLVWEWLTEPRKRTRYMTDVSWRAGSRPNGRTSAGAQNHCDHGKSTTVETILDWRPFEYFTSRSEDKQLAMVDTFYLEPMADGCTRLRDVIRFERTPIPLPNTIGIPLMKFVFRNVMKYDDIFERAAKMIEADLDRQQKELAVT